MPAEPDVEEFLRQIDGAIRSKDYVSAESFCNRVLQLVPKESRVWFRLGQIFLRQRRVDEAVSALRQAASLDPNDANTLSNLSVALLNQGHAAEGAVHAQRAIDMDSSQSGFWANLGACLFTQHLWDDASHAFRAAVDRDPTDPAMWSNFGAAEQRRGQLASAEAAFERSLRLAPNNINTIVNRASLLAQRGRPQAALDLVQRVLKSHSNHAPAWLTAGNAFQFLGDSAQAITALRRALQLAPKQLEVRYNLAHALSTQYLLDEAETLVRSILADHYSSADAWWLLGTILIKQGRPEEAVEALRRSIDLQQNAEYHGTYLLGLQYLDSATPESLLNAHREWDSIHGAAGRPFTPAGTTRGTSDRPLRIGFVSAEFRLHPVGFLSLGALERLDKSKCSLAFYSDRVAEDAFTERFRGAADVWRITAGLTNDEIAEQIRADHIDVLVDLMGHSGKRLPVFARRPSPTQITWLGYVGTTGLSAMDFLLADQFHVRPEEERWYTEKVLRMPHDYACYTPPAYAPDVGPLPALTNGFVTFGCFNNPAKFSPHTLESWANILRTVSDSKLLLKYSGLNQPSVQQRLHAHFAQNGIDVSRILIEGPSSHPELLAAYNRVDIALDPLVYSGGLTTCEALLMGVPVVTCPGKTFAGRHATSHMTNVGLSQFIAEDFERYIELAVSWATRFDELAQLRAKMRDQIATSALCDYSTFAKDFLATLQQACQLR